MPEEESIGEDVLGYGVPTSRMSEKKRKELEKKLKEELTSKKEEERKKREEIPSEGVPGEKPHEKKIGKTDTDKLVRVREHYRGYPSKEKEDE